MATASLRAAAVAAVSQHPTGRIRIRESFHRSRRLRKPIDCEELINKVAVSACAATRKVVPEDDVDCCPDDEVDVNDNSTAFFDRYALTVMHTQIITEVSFEDRDDDSVLLPLPGDEKALQLVDDGTCCDGDSESLIDTFLTDWNPLVGDDDDDDDDGDDGDDDYDVCDTLDGGDTLVGGEGLQVMLAIWDGVVNELGDVLFDCTYFFQCLKEEAENRWTRRSLIEP